MFKSATMYISLILVMMTSGCDNKADQEQRMKDTVVALGQGIGGTTGGDGTGGGIVQNDGSITGVDYKQVVSEKNLGLPLDPVGENRKTEIKIALQIPKIDNLKKIVAKSLNDKFIPNVNESYKIQDDRLRVTLSDKSSYPFVLYMFPFKESTTLAFAVFATLNNVAYNSIRLNQSNTAYYVKAARLFLGDTFVTAPVWNKSQLDVTQYNVAPELWHGSRIVISPTEPARFYPASVVRSCFKGFLACDTYKVNSKTISNTDSTRILFQPIATVGYLNYDWFNYVFQDPKLSKFDISKGNPSSDLIELAKKETLSKLRQEHVAHNGTADKNSVLQHNDIGWLGLPVKTRNSILRYHTVSVSMNVTFLDSAPADSTDIIIPHDGIELINYTYGVDQQSTPKSIGNEEKIIKFKVDKDVHEG